MTDHFCPIDHIAIDVVDFDTALAFFQDVFGMTVTRFQGPEEAPTSLWLDGGVQLCRVEAQAARNRLNACPRQGTQRLKFQVRHA